MTTAKGFTDPLFVADMRMLFFTPGGVVGEELGENQVQAAGSKFFDLCVFFQYLINPFQPVVVAGATYGFVF